MYVYILLICAHMMHPFALITSQSSLAKAESKGLAASYDLNKMEASFRSKDQACNALTAQVCA
jgi:ABC-type spermidine/putrescine transport system permease subunit I